MKLTRFIFTFILYLFTVGCYSQNSALDSLKNELKNTPPTQDTTIVSIQYEIGTEYLNIGRIDEALATFKAMKELAEKSNYFFGILKAKYGRANIHIANSEKEQALALFSEIEEQIATVAILDEHKKSIMGPIYSSMGNIYDYYSNYAKALEFHTRALKISKELGNDANYAVNLGNIASIYQKTGDFEEAINYQLKSIKIKEKKAIPYSLGVSYYNLSQIYNEKNDYQQEIDMLKVSLDYAEKANDLIGIALCNISIGNSYLAFYELTNDSLNPTSTIENLAHSKPTLLKKAFEYETKAINLLESIKEVKYIPHAYTVMGAVLTKQNKFKEAINYYLKAYKMTQNTNLDLSKNAAKGIYEVYKTTTNYKEALNWHEVYLTLKDSISNENNQKEIGKRQAELSFINSKEIEELRYQTEIEQLNHLNEKQQLVAQSEKRKQQYIIWSVTIGLFFIGTFLIIMIRRWKQTKRQKDTIDLQKNLIEKEKKSTEDSINYARNIQKVAFPSLAEVNRILPENFILFKPKNIVSGDFYWVNQQQNKKYIALADCTGHGVPGAFMTLIGLNILNQVMAEGVITPIRLLEELHIRLNKRLNNEGGNTAKHGLDIAICMLENDKVTYAGVHIPIYHVRNGRLTEYKGQKFQLGSENTTLFQQYEILTQKNDTIYISTDGFPDQKGGEKRKKYFYPAFREIGRAHV